MRTLCAAWSQAQDELTGDDGILYKASLRHKVLLFQSNEAGRPDDTGAVRVLVHAAAEGLDHIPRHALVLEVNLDLQACLSGFGCRIMHRLILRSGRIHPSLTSPPC